MQQPILDTIFFNITSLCNLNCRYCYLSDLGSTKLPSLSIKEIYHLAKEAKICGAKKVILSGGEPFIRKDWEEIFHVFQDFNYELSVSTNGTLIGPEIIKKIKQFRKIIFQVSLDGPSNIFDKITGKKGAFESVNRTLNQFKENQIDFMINCVIINDNYKYIPFLIDFAYTKKIFTRLTLLNNNYGKAKSNIKSLDISQINRLIKAVHLARSTFNLIELNLPPLLLNPDDWFSISPSCGWVQHQCGVLSNGDVTICGLAPKKGKLIAGNIKNKSFTDIWYNSDLFNNLRNCDTKKIKGVCSICPFLKVCGGSCRLNSLVKSNNCYNPDEFCQRYYNGLINHQIKEDDFPSGVINQGYMDLNMEIRS